MKRWDENTMLGCCKHLGNHQRGGDAGKGGIGRIMTHLKEERILLAELGGSTGAHTVQGQKTRGRLTHAKIHHLSGRGYAVLAILDRGRHFCRCGSATQTQCQLEGELGTTACERPQAFKDPSVLYTTRAL